MVEVYENLSKLSKPDFGKHFPALGLQPKLTMKQILIWPLTALSLVLVAASAPGVTTNLLPVADTTIHDAFPDNNFGSGTTFTSGGRNMGGKSRGLLRFDIAAAIPSGATINSASLSLTVTNANGANSNFDLKRVLAAWGEGTGTELGTGSTGLPGEATWNDRLGTGTPWTTAGGDFVGTPSASLAIGGLGTYTFTSAGLAADIQLWLNTPGTNFGWELISQSENSVGTIRRFGGKLDTNNPAKLIVNYTAAGGPANPPNIFDAARVGGNIRFSFSGQAGKTYTVEQRLTITSGWTTLTNIPTLASDTTVHVTNALSGTERFFQVKTP